MVRLLPGGSLETSSERSEDVEGTEAPVKHNDDELPLFCLVELEPHMLLGLFVEDVAHEGLKA